METKKRSGDELVVDAGSSRNRGQREAEKLLELRRTRMARRLDKIEKEMGYCEIKLEKERRLRKQVQFLKSDIAALDSLIRAHARWQIPAPQASIGRSAGEENRRPSRQAFMAAGLLEIVQEEREILARELEEINARLDSFTGFETKRTDLEEEKRSVLKDLAPTHSSRIRRMNEHFKKIERQWNSLTEDVINLDEAIFFLERNLDYLRSCRTFLISAKGSFDIEAWLSGGYLSDLFRHSNIGRAKEMADGADRNLKMALKELVCVSSVKTRPESFQRILHTLLEALFEDIFIEGKLQSSLRVVEAALAGNLKLVEQVKAKREVWGAKLDEVEKLRAQLFSRLEADRKAWQEG